jgi:DNA adenine methylase
MEVYNDINSDLVNFMRVLRDKEPEVTEWLNRTPFSREIYDDIATRWFKENLRPSDEVVWAGEFFYLRYTNFGSKSNQKAGFGVGSDKDNASDYTSARDELSRFADRVDGVHVEKLDWLDLVNRYDTDDALFYLDPPYPGTEYVYGDNMEFSLEDLSPLNDIEGDWILSTGAVPTDVLDVEHYEQKDTTRALGSASQGEGTKESKERLYCSFDPKTTPTFNPKMQSAMEW